MQHNFSLEKKRKKKLSFSVFRHFLDSVQNINLNVCLSYIGILLKEEYLEIKICYYFSQASKYCISDRGIDFFLKKVEEGPFWNKLLKDDKKVWLFHINYVFYLN